MSPRARWRRGVGIMLLDHEARIFVGRRIDTPDAWQMPQGGIDKSEAPLEAARRELKEETGIAAAAFIAETRAWLRYELPPELQRRPMWDGGFYRGQEQKWFAMRFTGTDAEIDLRTHHPEFDAWRWVEAAALPALAVPFKRALYEAVATEFREVLGAS